MNATLKTIRMKAADLAAWLSWLRNPSNLQATGALRGNRPDGQVGYCCLGGLQMALDCKVEMMGACGVGGVPEALPTEAWLKKHGIVFANSSGMLRESIAAPFLPAFNVSATTANDRLDKMFCEIADAIEACAETY